MAAPKWLPVAALLAVAGGAYLLFRRPSVPITRVPNRMNFSKRTKPIRGIVIHYTLTCSAKSTKSVLEQRGFSTNYEVDQEGKVYQYLDPDTQVAWATGGLANEHTIGIDVTYCDKKPFTPVQMEALRNLVLSLADRYGFPIVVAPDKVKQKWPEWEGKGFTLFRHRNFVATGCPGDFPLEQIFS